jgi:hypothetical protein
MMSSTEKSEKHTDSHQTEQRKGSEDERDKKHEVRDEQEHAREPFQASKIISNG